MSKVYFRNINTLRFIAAFVVIIHHLEQIKKYIFKMDNYWHIPFVQVVGKLGVILFFVLSGFLITYLLVYEEKVFNTISVVKFWMRRILRIWPLYFLLVILGFFILPQFNFFLKFNYNYSNHFNIKLLMYLFMLPNLAIALGAAFPFIAHLWSIGTEEQFYFFWPLIMKKIKSKFRLMFFIIAFYLIVKFALLLLFKYYGLSVFKVLHTFWNHTNIDCMAIGGLSGLILFYNKTHKIKNFLFSKITQSIVIIAIIVFIGKGVVIPYLHYEFYAVLFAILIVNLAGNPKNILKLENKAFNYLGKISYGIYMYHVIAIYLSLSLLANTSFNIFPVQLIMSSLVCIVISALSYELFEKRFLKLKRKFSKIVSGEI